jgi:hypothetical protein
MPTRRELLGISSATALALALGRPGGPALAQTGSSDAELTVSLRITRPSMEVAPAGYFFEAEVREAFEEAPATPAYSPAYDAGFHKPLYLWRTSDAGRFETPGHLVEAHRRKDQGTGRFFGKVFDTPGAHQVRVDVFYPDGRRGSASTRLRVEDPATAFAPVEIILVAADGDFGEAPPHLQTNAMRTLAEAYQRFGQLGTGRACILLKRGQIHDWRPEDPGLRFDAPGPDCLLGAWGQGPPPVVDLAAGGGTFLSIGPGWQGKTLVVRDLRFRGSWDPTVELWRAGSLTRLFYMQADATLVLHNCREDGCAVTLETRDPDRRGPAGAQIFFNEYAKTDFKDFLLLCPRQDVDIAITGCRVVQNLQALNGGENRRATSYALYGRNAHNFIRCSARRLYVAANDIFIRHGWAGAKIYDNHPFRLNRNNIPGMQAIIARNHIEGMIVRQSNDARNGAFPMNLLIEQNYIVDNPTVTPVMSFLSGPVTIRNNIIIEHDTPKLPKSGAAFKGFIGLDWDGVQAVNRDAPFFIYNNSFIDLKRDANAGQGPAIVFNKGGYTHVQEANNILWVPNQTTARLGDGPLDTTSLGWDARYLGVRLGWASRKGEVLPAAVPHRGAFVLPYWRDFLGHPLSRDSFAGEAGRHALRVQVNGRKRAFDGLKRQVAFRFDPNGITITNLSGVDWPAGAEITVHCDRGTTPGAMETAYGQAPGTLSLYRPLSDAGAAGTGAGPLLALVDFLGRVRPGAAHPQAPAGRPARGAMEPG